MADQATTWVPSRIVVGDEMAALRPFLVNCTWTGAVHPNGMGPGSPEMDVGGC